MRPSIGRAQAAHWAVARRDDGVQWSLDECTGVVDE